MLEREYVKVSFYLCNGVYDHVSPLLFIYRCINFIQPFVQANDAYLQMAIGNAPWPIGVTMVGIHARTGREKIFSKHVAHVLNDETQRKYIQVSLLDYSLQILSRLTLKIKYKLIMIARSLLGRNFSFSYLMHALNETHDCWHCSWKSIGITKY